MTKKAENPEPEVWRKPPPPPAPPKKVSGRFVHSWGDAGLPPQDMSNEGIICRKLAFYLARKDYAQLNNEEISLLGDLEQAGWIAVVRSEDGSGR